MPVKPKIDGAEILPTAKSVLGYLGGRSAPGPSERVNAMIARALEIFEREADPAAIYTDVTPADFARIYLGEGANAARTPLEEIYARATHLALFAATVGQRLSDRIQILFDAGDYALGAVLDAVASEGTEQIGTLLERHCLTAAENLRFLRYSPGYCGWDISGQRALFDALKPEEIGITLSSTYLMTPLKSISGVLVGGPAEIHSFVADYTFCETCTDKGCRARIRGISDRPGSE